VSMGMTGAGDDDVFVELDRAVDLVLPDAMPGEMR